MTPIPCLFIQSLIHSLHSLSDDAIIFISLKKKEKKVRSEIFRLMPNTKFVNEPIFVPTYSTYTPDVISNHPHVWIGSWEQTQRHCSYNFGLSTLSLSLPSHLDHSLKINHALTSPILKPTNQLFPDLISFCQYRRFFPVSLLWTECLCTPKFICWSLIPSVMVLGSGACGVIKSWGLMMGLVSL